MPGPVPYLLDTNAVLLATRENSPVSAAIDAQFGLRQSPFRPAVCEVTVAELLAFAQSWGDKQRTLLKQTIDELLVIPISRPEIHEAWAKMYSHAKANGLPIQHDHNDVWIATAAHVVAGLRQLSSDVAAFRSLRGTCLDVDLIDARSGLLIP